LIYAPNVPMAGIEELPEGIAASLRSAQFGDKVLSTP